MAARRMPAFAAWAAKTGRNSATATADLPKWRSGANGDFVGKEDGGKENEFIFFCKEVKYEIVVHHGV
jgi:hypothetical protein